MTGRPFGPWHSRFPYERVPILAKRHPVSSTYKSSLTKPSAFPTPPYRTRLKRYGVMVIPARGDGGTPTTFFGSFTKRVCSPDLQASLGGFPLDRSDAHDSPFSFTLTLNPVCSHSILRV